VILMPEPQATGATASDPTQDQLLPADRQPAADSLATRSGRLAAALERRAPWIEALIVFATIAAGFIVLGFLAAYFRDYFHLGLIFFLAWLLAFLVSPVADFIQQRLHRLPRAAAVVGVIVPVILVGAVIGVRIVVGLGQSFADLAAALPGLIANPPPMLTDVQAWLEARGIATDITSAYESIVGGILGGLTGGAGALFAGAAGAFGTFVDAIVVITLAIFMAIDRDKIMQFGIELMPVARRGDQLLFRRSVGAAFSGFIRSQLILGALYGLWALLVGLVFGLPYVAATTFLTGLIMAIPIYGPYVSWLPPVLVAMLISPTTALPVAIVMFIGWFINMNVLAPLVRSDSLQVHPIVITFAFLLGAQLAGPIGAIIAIPAAAVVQAFYFVYRDRYRGSKYPGGQVADAQGVPPIATTEAPT
jgi:predicted PurR-regulated permease PerM